MHEGHRSRLRQKFEKFGIDVLEDHELLELILFYMIKVKNTNGIAHKLLNKFGSLSKVYSATIKELCLVEGVGKKVAHFLKDFWDVHLLLLKQGKSPRYTGENHINYFYSVLGRVQAMLRNLYDDCFLLILADEKRRINFCDIIFKIRPGATSIDIEDIKHIRSIATIKKASFAVIAHNHINGILAPSQIDMKITEQLENEFLQRNMTLLEHFIVTEDGYTALSQYKKKYHM